MCSPRSAILAGPWGPMTGITCSWGLTQQHTWLPIPSRTTWLKLGRGGWKKVTGRWSRTWKSLWWPINSTTSSFRGIIRGNEIDSLHPISDDLITGLHLQGSLSEVLHRELVPFYPTPSHQLSATYGCSLFFQSYLVSDGPNGSLSHPTPPGPRIPLPWPSMLLGRMQWMYQETQGTQSLQPFWVSPWVGLQTVCLELPWLGTFAVEASVLSSWRPSIVTSAETAEVRG